MIQDSSDQTTYSIINDSPDQTTYSIINDSPDQTTYNIISHHQMTIIKTFLRKSTWHEKSRKIQPTTSTLHNSTIRVIVACTHMLRRSLQMTNLANGCNRHGQCNRTSISTVKLITTFSLQDGENHSKVTIFSARRSKPQQSYHILSARWSKSQQSYPILSVRWSKSQQSYHIFQCKAVKITAKLPHFECKMVKITAKLPHFSVQGSQNHSKVTTFFSARWSKSQQSYHIFQCKMVKIAAKLPHFQCKTIKISVLNNQIFCVKETISA